MGRVLVVEKHPVETSGSRHQIQIPKGAFARFFASRNATLSARVFNPPAAQTAAQRQATIRAYKNATNRINRITDLGNVGHALVFIEEHFSNGIYQYDIWWYPDPLASTIIRAWRGNWKRAKKSQHGPGRRWTIVAGIPSRNHAAWGNTPIQHI